MIAWSAAKLKFTSGIGGLCTAGLLADIFKEKIPIGVAVGVALFPLFVFVFVRPDEMPHRVVKIFQGIASLWYLVIAVSLVVLLVMRWEMPCAWPLYFVGLILGGIPCVIILSRLLKPPNDP